MEINGKEVLFFLPSFWWFFRLLACFKAFQCNRKQPLLGSRIDEPKTPWKGGKLFPSTRLSTWIALIDQLVVPRKTCISLYSLIYINQPWILRLILRSVLKCKTFESFKQRLKYQIKFTIQKRWLIHDYGFIWEELFANTSLI